MTGPAPDVTVIVPVYNTMPYLRQTLESLVGQTIGQDRLQVVAVDDGSTDGSGALLDEYAARHPGLFTVVHQPNSGGPAGPCNVGLDLAAGRYVYFLGADDHLRTDGLERMVAAADEWGSDVLCARMVGVGGRFVSQRLYEETRAEVPFPSRLLVMALSNTKLFRRAMLEEHDIRYRLDLGVGSDQPFTIEALARARRVSVLADDEYYYAVKRADQQNITYSSSYRARLSDIGAIMHHVADLFQAGDERDQILYRHFRSELSKLLQRDLPLLDEPQQKELVGGVAALADHYLTDQIMGWLPVLPAVRLHHAKAGDLDGLRALAGAEDHPATVLFTGELALEPYATLGQAPESLFVLRRRPLLAALEEVVDEAELRWEGDQLVLEARTRLDPRSSPHTRAALIPTPEPIGRPVLTMPRGKQTRDPRRAVTIAEDGLLRWQADVADLVPQGAESVHLALRLQFDGRKSYSVPVVAALPEPAVLRRGGQVLEIVPIADSDGRVLLTCAPRESLD